MYFRTLGIFAILSAKVLANTDNDKVYKYVGIFSIDGFHSSDVGKYVALRPQSTIATLLDTAYEYTDAFTSAPSDSYPGVMHYVTGANPRTTGMIIFKSPESI